MPDQPTQLDLTANRKQHAAGAQLEDTPPSLYHEATGGPYPGRPLDDNLMIGAEEMDDLRALSGHDRLHYEMTRDLLSLTCQQRNSARRAGLNKRIEQLIPRSFYDDPDDAIYGAQRLGAERKGLTAERPEGHPDQRGSAAETTPDPASSNTHAAPVRNRAVNVRTGSIVNRLTHPKSSSARRLPNRHNRSPHSSNSRPSEARRPAGPNTRRSGRSRR